MTNFKKENKVDNPNNKECTQIALKNPTPNEWNINTTLP
jgi:hypothetical protein